MKRSGIRAVRSIRRRYIFHPAMIFEDAIAGPPAGDCRLG
jgi:hypothetical protein